MFEGRAVQREGLVLAALSTHIAAISLPQLAQVGQQLADGLAQVFVRVKANGGNLGGGGGSGRGRQEALGARHRPAVSNKSCQEPADLASSKAHAVLDSQQE
jgi:hypothetical protein